MLFSRRGARLKSALLPQYLLLLGRPHRLRHRHDRLRSATASSRQVNRLALWSYVVRHILGTLSSAPNRIMVRPG
jgi:hypothetical protein